MANMVVEPNVKGFVKRTITLCLEFIDSNLDIAYDKPVFHKNLLNT